MVVPRVVCLLGLLALASSSLQGSLHAPTDWQNEMAEELAYKDQRQPRQPRQQLEGGGYGYHTVGLAEPRFAEVRDAPGSGGVTEAVEATAVACSPQEESFLARGAS